MHNLLNLFYYPVLASTMLAANRLPTPRKLKLNNPKVTQRRSIGYQAYMFTYLDVRQDETTKGIEAVSQRL